eukprot:symbB.v1.2.000305.t1/scaffold6.1/size569917/8
MDTALGQLGASLQEELNLILQPLVEQIVIQSTQTCVDLCKARLSELLDENQTPGDPVDPVYTAVTRGLGPTPDEAARASAKLLVSAALLSSGVLVEAPRGHVAFTTQATQTATGSTGSVSVSSTPTINVAEVVPVVPKTMAGSVSNTPTIKVTEIAGAATQTVAPVTKKAPAIPVAKVAKAIPPKAPMSTMAAPKPKVEPRKSFAEQVAGSVSSIFGKSTAPKAKSKAEASVPMAPEKAAEKAPSVMSMIRKSLVQTPKSEAESKEVKVEKTGGTVALPKPKSPARAFGSTRSVPKKPATNANKSLQEEMSAAATPSVEPPRLVRHLSQPPMMSRGVSGQRSPAPALLNRVISTPLEQVADPHKLEEELKRAHLAELLDKELQAELKKAQPDNVRDFVRDFCLRMAAPKFQHRLFFNARLGVSWRRAPQATYIVAATRIFRSLRRWLRRDLRRIGRTPRAPEPWAEARVAPMTAAALRSNWRRVEEAICKETSHEAGVASLQILLERGFDPNAAPFRVSPLLLASLAGNLHAAQFLYVRGGDMHQAGGVSQHQQLLPIDGASACGFLRLVAFFRENGSTGARALHFAASGGHLDVCKYLLATGVSPDLKADKGISAFTLALLYGECLAALVLLPHCSPANLEEALPGEVCWRLGLAGGSTVLHLAAHLGGSRERLLAPLLERCPVLLNRANWAQDFHKQGSSM